LSTLTWLRLPLISVLFAANVPAPAPYQLWPAIVSVNAASTVRAVKSAERLAAPNVPPLPSVSVGSVLPTSV
jgi:hypothetical protein